MSNFLIDEDTDLLAAEFVLGTLDSEERANAQSLLRTDHGFIAMVRIWERRFGELHLMVEPVEPDAKILQRIKAKIAEIAPTGPVPDYKPPTEVAPSRQPAGAAGSAAGMSMPAGGETPKPQDVSAGGPAPQDVPGAGISTTGEIEKPAETPTVLDAGVPTAADITVEAQPSPESEPPESLKVALPAPAGLKLSDKLPHQDQRPGRRPEATFDALRNSRGRWRALGVCLTFLVIGLVALLAAWRYAPDRLPPRLRAAELLMSFGIQPASKAAAPVEPAPLPEPQFDE